MTETPTADDCLKYMKRQTNADNPEIGEALVAETSAQSRACRTDPYTPDLREALLRRVACNFARRKLPLGVQESEVGGMRLSTTDPEIRRLEAPHRKLPVG